MQMFEVQHSCDHEIKFSARPLPYRVDEEQLPMNAAKLNKSGQVKGSSIAQEECSWGNYARGAIYALQKTGNHLKQVYFFFR